MTFLVGGKEAVKAARYAVLIIFFHCYPLLLLSPRKYLTWDVERNASQLPSFPVSTTMGGVIKSMKDAPLDLLAHYW